MSEIAPGSQEHDLDSGDRVQIRQGQRPLSNLIGHVGTIVEVFRMPLGSCLVRIDGDPDSKREWFLYRDEVTSNLV